MFKDKCPSPPTEPRSIQIEDAVFIGWQKTSWGEIIARYNITASGHPLFGSTVTDKTLRNLNLQTPKTTTIQGSGRPTTQKIPM